ncbi:uncharacterized protein LOC116116381 [Pistacia vera]|uniref:uncharacterized protein LOC116110369 n=1 Tax=Pistacia vera TaxID=55513 RepID=UPI001263BBE7|nr:uncharacterized protein LOC116110369 [Pistacia vera]XP_031258326.1 uncharacterized protein LOC116116381 [Pistacia vera]
MNCLSHATSYSASILRGTRNFIVRSSFHHQAYCPLTCKTNFGYLGVKTIDLDFLLNRFRVQCYTSRRSSTAKTSRSRKLNTEPVMEQDKDEFFVVRKGDVVGVYKSLAECQAQVGSSVCHPPVSVYKGYSLPKDTEEYLVSHGLKNALYTIRAADLTEGLFGSLTPCPFQETPGSTSILTDPLKKHVKLDHDVETQAAPSDSRSCIIEFDGASKGNPGPAGAAAVLRTNDGSLICKLREGMGIATNNVAEYRALILGLKYALRKGYTNIQVRGDSKLVCMQVLGSWKAKNSNMSDLCTEAKKLKDGFLSFQMTHVLRDLNSEADAQANLAVHLGDGQVTENFE